MKIRAAVAIPFLAVILTGCATTDKLNEMRRQRDVLAAELGVAKDRNSALEMEKKTLQDEIGDLSDVRSSLEREKDARQLETTGIRKQARVFLQTQLGQLREFSKNHDLLDRIGGELIARKHVEGKNILLIDMEHPLPSSGTLLSGNVYGNGPCSLSFCLFRPQGDRLSMIWSSRLFKIDKAGIHTLVFEVPVGAEKGDLVGLYCPDSLQVPYDRGTGNTGSIGGPLKVGSAVEKSMLKNRDGRTYSFAVSGFLE